MSESANRFEAQRWLTTAEEDLLAGDTLANAGMHAHACFQAHQAGLKAMMAVWLDMGGDPWGHSVLKLLLDLPDPATLERFRPLADYAALLDKFYIPTQFPHALPELSPSANYRSGDSERAMSAARELLDATRACIVPPGSVDPLLGGAGEFGAPGSEFL